MENSDQRSTRSVRSTVLGVVKVIWLPVLVFVAFDTSVPKEMSILRKLDNGEQRRTTVLSGNAISADPVAPHGVDTDANGGSAHAYFGLEEDTANESEEKAEVAKSGLSTALGQWSGRFAGILEGDDSTDCWSAYDFNLVLNERDSGVSGSGSYWVDPASCSSHEDRYVAFIDATGLRAGNRVSIDITGSNSGTGDLVFDGLIMRGRLTGWFYSADGKPVSGPVVLTRK